MLFIIKYQLNGWALYEMQYSQNAMFSAPGKIHCRFGTLRSGLCVYLRSKTKIGWYISIRANFYRRMGATCYGFHFIPFYYYYFLF